MVDRHRCCSQTFIVCSEAYVHLVQLETRESRLSAGSFLIPSCSGLLSPSALTRVSPHTFSCSLYGRVWLDKVCRVPSCEPYVQSQLRKRGLWAKPTGSVFCDDHFFLHIEHLQYEVAMGAPMTGRNKHAFFLRTLAESMNF